VKSGRHETPGRYACLCVTCGGYSAGAARNSPAKTPPPRQLMPRWRFSPAAGSRRRHARPRGVPAPRRWRRHIRYRGRLSGGPQVRLLLLSAAPAALCLDRHCTVRRLRVSRHHRDLPHLIAAGRPRSGGAEKCMGVSGHSAGSQKENITKNLDAWENHICKNAARRALLPPRRRLRAALDELDGITRRRCAACLLPRTAGRLLSPGRTRAALRAAQRTYEERREEEIGSKLAYAAATGRHRAALRGTPPALRYAPSPSLRSALFRLRFLYQAACGTSRIALWKATEASANSGGRAGGVYRRLAARRRPARIWRFFCSGVRWR